MPDDWQAREGGRGRGGPGNRTIRKTAEVPPVPAGPDRRLGAVGICLLIAVRAPAQTDAGTKSMQVEPIELNAAEADEARAARDLTGEAAAEEEAQDAGPAEAETEAAAAAAGDAQADPAQAGAAVSAAARAGADAADRSTASIAGSLR